MKTLNYLLSCILTVAILFASCSTQPKYTAFGGGWGTEKTKAFQAPNASAKQTTASKNQISSAEEKVVLNEVNDKITQSTESENLTVNNKDQKHRANLNLSNSTKSITKPSIFKISKLFTPKKKVNSSGENGTDNAPFGILGLVCGFLALLMLLTSGIKLFLPILVVCILGIVFSAMGLNSYNRGISVIGLIFSILTIFLLLMAVIAAIGSLLH